MLDDAGRRERRIEAELESVQARYGRVLTADELERLRDDLGRVLDHLDLMRAVPLKNSDEPAAELHVPGWDAR